MVRSSVVDGQDEASCKGGPKGGSKLLTAIGCEVEGDAKAGHPVEAEGTCRLSAVMSDIGMALGQLV